MSRRLFHSQSLGPLGPALAIVVVLGCGCFQYSRAPEADAFVAELQCGMTGEQIAAAGERHRLKVSPLDSNLAGWNLLAEKHQTRVRMKLGSSGLERYRISWVDTIKHVTVLPVVELCAAKSGSDGHQGAADSP